MMKWLIYIALSFLIPCVGFGQNEAIFAIEGQVLDKFSQLPLDSARVSLCFQSGDTVTMYTDSNGIFAHQLDTNWYFIVFVSKPGYYNAKGHEMDAKPDSSTVVFHLYEMADNSPPIKQPEVFFKKYSLEYDPVYDTVLTLYTAIMKDNPTIVIELTGFRDHDEDTIMAWDRAELIRKLLTQNDIHPDRIQTNARPNYYFYQKEEMKKYKGTPRFDEIESFQRRVEMGVIADDFEVESQE